MAQTATAEHGDSRLIAYVGNWQDCPTTDQTDSYTHLIVAFAVSYTWGPWKNECDEQCNIITGREDGLVTVCENSVNQELVNSWRDAGKKVILSFGGAGMGGSWHADQNNCWDYCFGREEELSTALVTIVQKQNFDGIDIDYEYCYDADNGRHDMGFGCAQASELYSDEKAQNFLSTMTILLRQKLDALGRGYELTHAPMDPDLVPDSPYYAILKEHGHRLDFLMPQFYNGHTRPAADGFDAKGLGQIETSTVYSNLANDVFGGKPEKVVFGFCISDCSRGGSDASGPQAVDVLQQLKAHNGEEFACNGGAFFWVAFKDEGGTWGNDVWEEVKKTSGCSFSVDDIETVLLKFNVVGIPSGDIDAIKAEITTIMDRILLRVEELIPGMEVYSVTEIEPANINAVTGGEASMYYYVSIVNNVDRDINSAITQELRDSYDGIIYSIPFSDLRYINRDLEFNWCANTGSGGYNLCVREKPTFTTATPQLGYTTPTVHPTARSNFDDATPSFEPLPATVQVQSNSNSNNSLPGWAVGLLFVLCVSLLICIGYLILERRKRIGNPDAYDDGTRQTDSNRSLSWRNEARGERESWVTSSASIRSEQSNASKSIGSASYGSRTTREALKELAERGNDISTITVSNPDQQRGLDPDSGAPSSSRRHYNNEEPSNKPRRDHLVFL